MVGFGEHEDDTPPPEGGAQTSSLTPTKTQTETQTETLSPTLTSTLTPPETQTETLTPTETQTETLTPTETLTLTETPPPPPSGYEEVEQLSFLVATTPSLQEDTPITDIRAFTSSLLLHPYHKVLS